MGINLGNCQIDGVKLIFFRLYVVICTGCGNFYHTHWILYFSVWYKKIDIQLKSWYWYNQTSLNFHIKYFWSSCFKWMSNLVRYIYLSNGWWLFQNSKDFVFQFNWIWILRTLNYVSLNFQIFTSSPCRTMPIGFVWSKQDLFWIFILSTINSFEIKLINCCHQAVYCYFAFYLNVHSHAKHLFSN